MAFQNINLYNKTLKSPSGRLVSSCWDSYEIDAWMSQIPYYLPHFEIFFQYLYYPYYPDD